LLKQREEFKKRATAQPTVSKRPAPSADSAKEKKKSHKKKKSSDTPNSNARVLADLSIPAASSTAANFSTLAKIIDYMKKRHLNKQNWPLSLKEILEEVQVFDLPKRSEAWLAEILPTNRRISVDEGKFIFKPPYRVKGTTSLLTVLKRHDMEGKGGILLSDLNECIPNADKIAQLLGDAVIDIPTQISKRKDHVYFYNDPEASFKVNEEFCSIWRNVSVDHLDEKKIEEYLQKHGIDTMRDLAPKKGSGPPKRKTVKRKTVTKVHNEHLTNVLETYVNE